MNVTLPQRIAVDLYIATGITVGAQLKVTNLTTGAVRLSTSCNYFVISYSPKLGV